LRFYSNAELLKEKEIAHFESFLQYGFQKKYLNAWQSNVLDILRNFKCAFLSRFRVRRPVKFMVSSSMRRKITFVSSIEIQGLYPDNQLHKAEVLLRACPPLFSGFFPADLDCPQETVIPEAACPSSSAQPNILKDCRPPGGLTICNPEKDGTSEYCWEGT